MDQKVLIAYATKYGATAEIARRLGETLKGEGLSVEVLPVKKASAPDQYTAVVLGSAVYIGSWRKEAAKYLQENESALAKLPVWLFSSGPTGEGDPVELLKGWRLPPALQPVVDRIQPRDIAVFGGDLDEDKISFLEKFMIKNVKAPTGDFRDWEAVEAWGKGIAAALKG
jgi:menaquinone-dependent protoporphyrinogen oxidase